MSVVPVDGIFQNTLQDLVKGIRSHKKDLTQYISLQIVEIKNELKSMDIFIKYEAIRKLTYLQMIGYNVSWASFAIIEVMSQSKFCHKRVGYSAANQVSTHPPIHILLIHTSYVIRTKFYIILLHVYYVFI